MQQNSNHWSEKNFSPTIHLIRDLRLISISTDFKNDINEIQWMFGQNFFQTSHLVFVASKFNP